MRVIVFFDEVNTSELV
jgi:E3 ubiquitin-protein ligase RNF213